MKKSIQLLLSIALLIIVSASHAKADKWYRVEMLIFEMKGYQPHIEESDIGKPAMGNAVSLNTDPSSEFSVLSDNQLAFLDAKKRIQKNYHLVLHKGWRQMITDKEHAQKVHLIGGKSLGGAIAGDFEVDGTVRLSLGRNLNVDADLLFRKPTSDKIQAFRLKESSRLRVNEISYIDHPNYGVIIMVTPEKTAEVAPSAAKSTQKKTA
jgi:hypothetical protein